MQEYASLLPGLKIIQCLYLSSAEEGTAESHVEQLTSEAIFILSYNHIPLVTRGMVPRFHVTTFSGFWEGLVSIRSGSSGFWNV